MLFAATSLLQTWVVFIGAKLMKILHLFTTKNCQKRKTRSLKNSREDHIFNNAVQLKTNITDNWPIFHK